MKSVVN